MVLILIRVYSDQLSVFKFYLIVLISEHVSSYMTDNNLPEYLYTLHSCVLLVRYLKLI